MAKKPSSRNSEVNKYTESDNSRRGGFSDITIQSPLSPLNLPDVSRNEADVKLEDILAAPMTIGLKTATDKDLVKKIEHDHNVKEAERAACAEQDGTFEYDSFANSASRHSGSKEKSRPKTESAYTSNSNVKSGRSASESDSHYSQRRSR